VAVNLVVVVVVVACIVSIASRVAVSQSRRRARRPASLSETFP